MRSPSEDVGGQRVIQTDAATFTSTQGDQVVQGFNCLIPVETVREAAAKAAVVPTGQSEFSRLWRARRIGAPVAKDATGPLRGPPTWETNRALVPACPIGDGCGERGAGRGILTSTGLPLLE